MSGGCNCASDWRLEIIDLATGVRVRYLDFLSFDFEDALNQVGTATVVAPVDKVTARDVWPHLRAVVFTRVNGPGASKSAPVAEYIGMVETMSATSDGTVTLGLQSIEYYLQYRIIVNDTSYPAGSDQCDIGAALVNLAVSGGIPLTGASPDVSAYTRERNYAAADDKRILEAVAELTQVSDGPDYRRDFSYSGGAWSTVLTFLDTVGTNAGSLNGKRGLSVYGVDVDGTQHVNWERGRGESMSSTQDTLTGSIYPRFDKGIQWSDVTDQDTLDENVLGDLVNNFDPIAIPNVTIARLSIAASLNIGDTVPLDINRGALRYKGDARIASKSWSRPASGAPTTCTLSFVPPSNAGSAILNAPASSRTGCC